MRNNNYIRPPRKGVIVFASFVFAALFVIAFIISYEQRTDLAHSVHLSPTSANYGTVSTVRSSSLAVPMHSTAPLLSSGTIHAYAYSGHATMPSTGSSSGFRIHTLSSATMHTYGSGSGGGGGAVSGGSSSSPSSPTIRYSGVSVSMPSLAMAAPARTQSSSFTQTDESTYSPTSHPTRTPRRAPGYEGSEEGEQGEEGGKYWMWDGEEWIDLGAIPVGTTKIEGGKTYRWNGSSWEIIGDQQNPGVPIGEMPWWLIFALGALYLLTTALRKKSQAFN